MTGLRERKKQAMRLQISNVATALFAKRGFDNVTVDEVAAAADVSKMTVFNYFATKEDLLFDRSDEAPQLVRACLANRGARAPLAALHALVRELFEQKHHLVRMSPQVASFWKTVGDSAALRAHARKVAAQLESDLGRMLAESVGAAKDPIAELLATLLMGTWRVAFREGLRKQKAFLEIIDRGFAAATAAAKGTAYVT